MFNIKKAMGKLEEQGKPIGYALDGKKVVPIYDRSDLQVAATQRMSEAYRVALDFAQPYAISTVFLGVNCNPDEDGEPLLFETAVNYVSNKTTRFLCFDLVMYDPGNTILKSWRTSTYKEAERVHRDVVKALNGDTSWKLAQRLNQCRVQ